jgi:hypothetical protein
MELKVRMELKKYDVVHRMPLKTREDFYQVIRILNSACGKGNWKMWPRKTLREFKRNEKYGTNRSIFRDIYVPPDNPTVISLLELLK